MSLIDRAERSFFPDWMIRIRRLLAARSKKQDRGDLEHQPEAEERFIEALRHRPIAIAKDVYHGGSEWFVSHYLFFRPLKHDPAVLH